MSFLRAAFLTLFLGSLTVAAPALAAEQSDDDLIASGGACTGGGIEGLGLSLVAGAGLLLKRRR